MPRRGDTSTHLRKARFVVLYKSKPVGAGAITDLEEPAHSDKADGRNMSDQFTIETPPSVIQERRLYPTPA